MSAETLREYEACDLNFTKTLNTFIKAQFASVCSLLCTRNYQRMTSLLSYIRQAQEDVGGDLADKNFVHGDTLTSTGSSSSNPYQVHKSTPYVISRRSSHASNRCENALLHQVLSHLLCGRYPIAQHQKLAAEIEALLAEHIVAEYKAQDSRHDYYFGQAAVEFQPSNMRRLTNTCQMFDDTFDSMSEIGSGKVIWPRAFSSVDRSELNS